MESAHSEDHVLGELGWIVRALRARADLTLAEAARRSGLSPAFLSEVERGRKDASTRALVALARGLGADVGEIYAELGRRLGAQQPEWHDDDPRVQLEATAARLDREALRTVAQFGAFLALSQPAPTKHPIGFQLGRDIQAKETQP
jgi:XRE family transcriptional regulator, stress-response regulator